MQTTRSLPITQGPSLDLGMTRKEIVRQNRSAATPSTRCALRTNVQVSVFSLLPHVLPHEGAAHIPYRPTAAPSSSGDICPSRLEERRIAAAGRNQPPACELPVASLMNGTLSAAEEADLDLVIDRYPPASYLPT